jgi:S1-C subfamily serine protease
VGLRLGDLVIALEGARVKGSADIHAKLEENVIGVRVVLRAARRGRRTSRCGPRELSTV